MSSDEQPVGSESVVVKESVYTFSNKAHHKILLHAAKYPWADIYGNTRFVL